MYGSSELSDALNPNLAQRRRSNYSSSTPNAPSIHEDTGSPIPVLQQYHLQQPVYYPVVNETLHAVPVYTPHRSELEDAINPAYTSQLPPVDPLSTQPAVPATPPPIVETSPPTVPKNPARFFKNLLFTVASYKKAVDAERVRRQEWEQAQEERERQTGRRISEMQTEIDDLKEYIRSNRLPMPGEPQEASKSVTQPEFIEGSSAEKSTEYQIPIGRRSTDLIVMDEPDTRQATPTFIQVYGTEIPRKQRVEPPQTIQAVVWNHIIRAMDIETDDNLPPSHVENRPLASGQPVRFIWEKTIKKSAHNEQMKARILLMVLDNRDLYSLVPDEDFEKTSLDHTFDQAYKTLRQKFKSQQGNSTWTNRNAMRSQRSRRASRKKYKLKARSNVRHDFEEYSSAPFDPAFNIDCMSSEESTDGEDELDVRSSDDEENQSKGPGVLRVRYLSWRSARLHALYRILDEKEEHLRGQKRKRGQERKDRRMGLPKDGNPLPPIGTPRWMISKRWITEIRKRNDTHLTRSVDELLESAGDEDEVQEDVLTTLGEESDEELDLEATSTHQAVDQLDHTELTSWQYASGYIAMENEFS